MRSVLLILLCLATSCTPAQNRLQQARDLINQRYFPEALDILDQIIEENPTDSAYVTRGYAFMMTGNKYRSKMDYDKVLSNPKLKLFALLSRASAYFNLGVYDTALTEYSNIISRYPDNSFAYIGRGMSKTYNAIAGDDDPNDLSSTYDQNGRLVHYDFNGALSDLNIALKLDPDNAEGYRARSEVFQKMKSYASAIEDYDKVIQIEPKNYLNYLNRGLIYKDLKNSRKALEDFNHAINLNPLDPFSYSNRGFLKGEQLNDKKGACADLKKAEELGLSMSAEDRMYCN